MTTNRVIVSYLSAKSMLNNSKDLDRRDYARRELLKYENELYIILDKELDLKELRLIEVILNN